MSKNKSLLKLKLLTRNIINKEDKDSDKVKLSLLRFFDQSIVSRETLKALVNIDEKLKLQEITANVNTWFTRKDMSKVPENVIRKIIMILMGSDLVNMKDDKFCASELGKNICELMKSHKK